MSYQETARRIDSAMFAAFQRAGFADAAVYVSPDGERTPCTVLYHEIALEDAGDPRSAVVAKRDIEFQRSEVRPVAGGLVEIGTQTWRLLRPTTGDVSLSLSRWSVAPVVTQ